MARMNNNISLRRKRYPVSRKRPILPQCDFCKTTNVCCIIPLALRYHGSRFPSRENLPVIVLISPNRSCGLRSRQATLCMRPSIPRKAEDQQDDEETERPNSHPATLLNIQTISKAPRPDSHIGTARGRRRYHHRRLSTRPAPLDARSRRPLRCRASWARAEMPARPRKQARPPSRSRLSRWRISGSSQRSQDAHLRRAFVVDAGARCEHQPCGASPSVHCHTGRTSRRQPCRRDHARGDREPGRPRTHHSRRDPAGRRSSAPDRAHRNRRPTRSPVPTTRLGDTRQGLESASLGRGLLSRSGSPSWGLPAGTETGCPRTGRAPAHALQVDAGGYGRPPAG